MSFVPTREFAKMFGRFVTVGLINTFIGLSLIYFFKWVFGFGDLVANFLGYSICIYIGFRLNYRWTFGYREKNLNTLVGYCMVSGCAYLANLFTIYLAMSFFALSGDLSHLLGAVVFTSTAFILNKSFVFTKKVVT